MMSSFFMLFVLSVFLTGCLGVKGDGTVLLQESIEHLVNYTAYEALDHLNLENIGSNIANTAYDSYKDALGYEYPRHCNDFSRIRSPPADSGITIIRPDDGKPFPVYCNMNMFGGGWTRILYRHSQQMSFHLDWNAYKNGFGYLGSDGWLGLEKIHRLTKYKPAKLLISLRAKNYNYYYPQYRHFQVGNETTKYQLYIADYTGDGGNSLSYSNHARFSTYDKDHDTSSSNCASSHRGGWWYYKCAQGKLTGDPYTASTSNNYAKWPGVGNDAVLYATMEIKLSDY